MATPQITDTVPLFCPFADGVGAQSVSYVLSDFDGEHNLIQRQLTATFDSQLAQNTLNVTFASNGDGTTTVTIATKAPKPLNQATGKVTISDGRSKNDGSAVPPIVVTVQFQNRPDASSLEITSRGPVVDLDPKLPA